MLSHRNIPRLFIASTIGLAALTLAGCGQTTTTPPTTSTGGVSMNTTYKDGTYTAVGDYRAPSGAEQIGVTVTLSNNVITDSSIEIKALNGISKNWQTQFAQNYKTFVVGKNINEVNVGKVSGSSLTPHGFNDAIAKIKAQAA